MCSAVAGWNQLLRIAVRFSINGFNLLLSNGGVIRNAAGKGNHTDTINTAIEIQGDGGTATYSDAGATGVTARYDRLRMP